jgi:hypothetical protein
MFNVDFYKLLYPADTATASLCGGFSMCKNLGSIVLGMQRFAILTFQGLCWLLYIALAIYVQAQYGWTLFLILLFQFLIVLLIQKQLTQQKGEIDKINDELQKLKQLTSGTSRGHDNL